MAQGTLGQSFTQQGEGVVGVCVFPFRVVSGGFAAEHGIVDARHQRAVGGQRIGQLQTACSKLAGHVFQVGLVEYAFRPVVCYLGQVFFQQSAALCGEAAQVGMDGNSVGGETAQRAPAFGEGSVGLLGRHPGQHLSHLFYILHDGEEQCGLYVVGASQQVGTDAAFFKPEGERSVQEGGMRIVDVASEGIVVAVGAEHVGRFAYRLDVDAYSVGQFYGPVVFRNAGNDVVRGIAPACSKSRVFHPNELVASVRTVGDDGVLGKDRGLVLHAFLNDETLVLYEILYGHGRGDHFGCGAEVVELSARKRQDRHAERGQFFVCLRGMAAQSAAEGGIEIVEADFPVFACGAFMKQLHGSV